MEKTRSSFWLSFCKYLLFSYLFTAGILFLLAFILYRFGLSEKAVGLAMIAIYVTASFLVGFLTGKKAQSRKFFWGMVMGAAYFLILAVISLAWNGQKALSEGFLRTLLLCAGGGMLGGILS